MRIDKPKSALNDVGYWVLCGYQCERYASRHSQNCYVDVIAPEGFSASKGPKMVVSGPSREGRVATHRRFHRKPKGRDHLRRLRK